MKRKRINSTTRRPTRAAVRAARHAADLTQTEAARVIYSTLRTWQEWESGTRRCHPAMFELFLMKTGQLAHTPTKG